MTGLTPFNINTGAKVVHFLRDTDFDLTSDQDACLHYTPEGGLLAGGYDPTDARRVSQIFRNPQFFVDGAGSSDVVQGISPFFASVRRFSTTFTQGAWAIVGS